MASGELDGRTALVTGAARGIGRAVAERLAASGARVLMVDRDLGEGETAAEAVRSAGGQAEFFAADQALDADWVRLMTGVERLDVLVLCAGVARAAPIADVTVDDCVALNAINLKGVYLGLKHGVDAIRRGGRGGSVILMSSIVGKIGMAGYGAYAASKGGVRLLAKAAALELGPERIRVNSMHPGVIATDMNAATSREVVSPMIPLGRFGEAREMADGVLFLASDRSLFMTGAELVEDGGFIIQ